MTNSNRDVLRAAASLWWLVSLFGILTVGVGVFLVVSPHETLKTIAIIVGIVLLVDGIVVVLGSIFGERENRGLLALAGVLGAVAGIVLIKKPFQTLIVLALIVGLWLVVAGGVRFVASLSQREDRGVNIFVSLVDVIAGIVILAWPKLGLSTFAVIVGIVLIIRGILLTYAGWVLRAVGRDVGASEASAAA
jgi:uncharacterized membrane protein HdeD (DUF308 family)